MARYHFHFRHRDVVVRDEDGVELDSLAAAHARAWKLVTKTLTLVPEPSAHRDWVVEVETEGRVQLSVLFPAPW